MSTEMEHQEVEGSLLLGVSNNNLVKYQDASQGQVSEKKTGILVQDKLHGTSCSDTRTHACIDTLTTKKKASVAEEGTIEDMEAALCPIAT